jgi:hypothetical protein
MHGNVRYQAGQDLQGKKIGETNAECNSRSFAGEICAICTYFVGRSTNVQIPAEKLFTDLPKTMLESTRDRFDLSADMTVVAGIGRRRGCEGKAVG